MAVDTFGTALRQLRSARGLSLADLGALVNYSRQYIWDLERNRRQPHPELAATLDAALAAGGRLVEAAARHLDENIDGPWTIQAANDVIAHVTESALMDRRGFLVLSGGTLTGMALEWSATNAGHPVVEANGWVTPDAIGHLQARLTDLWHLDDLIGGGNILDTGVADLRLVERLIRHGRYSTAVRAQLYGLAAALARFCGWAAFDAGREAAAQRFWHAALRSSAAAGDTDQGVYVISNLALQAIYAGDGQTSVALLDVARRRVDPTARTVLAMLDCWAVRGHALQGDTRTAAALLNRADDMWANRRAGDDPSWVYWMPRPSTTAEAGSALLGIGDLAAAERSLTAGLADLDADSARDRNLYLVRLAEVRLRGGSLDEAADTARTAIDTAADIDSARVTARMDHLLNLMPAAEPVTADLHEYRREAVAG